jgi:SAM-dependent methyltransferase
MNQQSQWQVAGSAPEIYERELVPAVFGAWAPVLVDLAQPRSGHRVVDVACGTGIVARIAAMRVGPTGAVVGIDLNPGMLSVARSAASTEPRSGGPLQWQEASADKLPLADGSFDIVYCQLGLQFFADRAAALREMRRVLDTEGRLALMMVRDTRQSRICRDGGSIAATRWSSGGSYHARAIWVVRCRRIGSSRSCRGFSERRN